MVTTGITSHPLPSIPQRHQPSLTSLFFSYLSFAFFCSCLNPKFSFSIPLYFHRTLLDTLIHFSLVAVLGYSSFIGDSPEQWSDSAVTCRLQPLWGLRTSLLVGPARSLPMEPGPPLLASQRSGPCSQQRHDLRLVLPLHSSTLYPPFCPSAIAMFSR